MYGVDSIGMRTAQDWFVKFKTGNSNLDNFGRPSYFDEDYLKALMKEDGRQTTRELAENMDCLQDHY